MSFGNAESMTLRSYVERITPAWTPSSSRKQTGSRRSLDAGFGKACRQLLWSTSGLIAGLGLAALLAVPDAHAQSPDTQEQTGPIQAGAVEEGGNRPAALRRDGAPRLRGFLEEASIWAREITGRRDDDSGFAQSLADRAAQSAAEGDFYSARQNMLDSIGYGNADPTRWLTLAEYIQAYDERDMRAVYAGLNQAATKGSTDVVRSRAQELAADVLKGLNEDGAAFLLYRRSVETRFDQDVLDKARVIAGEIIRMDRWDVDAERDVPRVCFVFSDQLDAARINEAEYVRIEQTVDVAQSVLDNRLCLDGLVHGQSYEVLLRAGLPSLVDGVVMDRARSVSVVIPERMPRVAFTGNGFILPRVGKQEIPVHSINLSEVAVDVFRLNDRTLIDDLVEHGFSRALDGWDADLLEEQTGEKVWSGRLDVSGSRNQVVTTHIPFVDAVPLAQPGVYAVMATPAFGETSQWRNRATQWVMVTDIGLQTAWGEDGLTVTTRSLATGRPLWGVDLRLIARNNDLRASVVTDRGGRARFTPGLMRGDGGTTPTAIMAYGAGGDFAVLDLTGPAFDLSDRGVSGRPAPGPIDAMIYTDRGIYRPGETVQLVSLLRNPSARALSDLPLTISLVRPDGVEAARLLPSEHAQGGYHHSYSLLDSARTGQWRIEARVDPSAPPVGVAHFTVEDFVPARLDVRMTANRESVWVPSAWMPPVVATAVPDGPAAALPPAEQIGLDEDPTTPVISVQADFLYGGAASELAVLGEVVLRRAATPYPEYPDHRFGLVQETITDQRLALDDTQTDETGAAQFTLGIDGPIDSTHPLEVLVRASVLEPGGRATSRAMVLPVRHQALAIGIDPAFEDGSIASDTKPSASVVVLGQDASPVVGQRLSWSLIQEVARYSWYRSNGVWRYRRIVEDVSVGSGDVVSDGDGVALPDLPVVEGGAYRLEVLDPEGRTASSLRFTAGWWVSGPQSGDTPPDRITVTAQGDPQAPGSAAQVFIQAPFAGEAQIMIATDQVIDVINIPLPGDGLVVELPVTDAWGVGAYVTVTAFRPGDAGGRGPDRAMGVAWIPVDLSDRRYEVAIDTPEKVVPRQTIEVPVRVSGPEGAAPTEPVFVTLAAVDEGILQLTNFQTPDPEGFFYGKRRLGLDFRDAYGRLIRTADGQAGVLRSGGDAAGRHAPGLPDKSVKTVALFSGILTTDADGVVRVPVEIPDFNGRLRLMAVAYSANALGSGETDLIVRDPLVAQVTVPRFLSAGDSATITVALDNVDGPAGRYQMTLRMSGRSAVVQGTGGYSGEIAEQGRERVTATVQARTVGSDVLTMTLLGPGGFERVAEWPLSVRPIRPRETRAYVQVIPPNGQFLLTDAVTEDLWPGDQSVAITNDVFAGLDVPGLIRNLDRYPYGCLEQTVSRALPLLHVTDLDRLLDTKPDSPVARSGGSQSAIINAAIRQVVAMQRSDGGFGLWSSSGAFAPWATAYAADFLIQAAQQGHAVPGFVLDNAITRLRRAVRDADFSPAELTFASYAYLVLARAGAIDLGALRYVQDVYGHDLPSVTAQSQLAAALAIAGDRTRAQRAFTALLEDPVAADSAEGEARVIPARLYQAGGFDYGSNVRDWAVAIQLATETGMLAPDAVQSLTERLAIAVSAREGRASSFSTQEQAWLVAAAGGILRDSVPGSVTLDGAMVPLSLAQAVRPSAEDLQRGMLLRNEGTAPVRMVVSVDGIPFGDPEPVAAGLELSRRYLDASGAPLDLDSVRQGDVVAVVLEGRITDAQLTAFGREARLLVVDLLPAGLEIETPNVQGMRTLDDAEGLPELSLTDHMEARDDRFVASVTLRGRDRNFAVAYVARATSVGSFRQPGVFAEDMYNPVHRVAGEAGVFVIQPRTAQ